MDSEQRALSALGDIAHRVVRHGPVSSLEEAAAIRGLPVSAVLKTLVVRRAEDDYLFVLVPGGRRISWPKLRALLGVSRLSLPDADDAFARTGYRKGTITPYGATTAWPVVVDASVTGEVSIGAGADGVTALLQTDDLVSSLAAQVADVTEPAAP